MSNDAIGQHRVMVQGLSTVYLEAGSGPVLLLVHGNITTFRSWLPVVAEFRGTHRVIAVSLPGFSGTSPQAQVCLDALVSFVGAFLDAMAIDEATVLGHSAGGLIAATFALEHPERVTRLVLMDSAGLGRAVNPSLVAGALLPGWAVDLAITALLLPGAGVARALMSLAQLRQPWRVGVREWRDQIRLTESRTLLSTSLRMVRMAVGPTGQRRHYSVAHRLGDLSMPTMVIWGLTDEVFPIWQGVRAARKLPRGRFAVLATAGHVGYLDSHVGFVDALSPFIRDEPSAGSTVDGEG
ncbi:alpha/beta fold hydrolase [Actinophytocola sp.]|uniref:alpha/beta fold hydrolase n=1 Tax=Actinophytocola sp. TaxID=1872138 RepID=UPI00389A63C8